MTGESMLEELRREHEAVLAGVRAMIEEVERVEAAGAEPTPEAIAACRERVHSLRRAFTIHRCHEEVALFPEVEQFVSQGAPRVDILGSFFAGEAEDDITAHVEIEQRLERLDALLEQLAEGNDARAVLGDTARALADLLSRHAKKEDTEIFPLMLRTLTENQLNNIAERLAELCETGSVRET
ncbi:MAG: hemerythrin domain-containing protein [Armatimonadetes bacterium]|nr:hemerythrin domain-containing protein [Armatimonadota bacterium]